MGAGATLALMVAAGALLSPGIEAQSAAHLTLVKTVNRIATRVGATLTYTVTLGNSGTSSAANVTVDDVLGGDAGYVVNDGTGGTVNSFEGSVVITVAKVTTGHYRWSYSTVHPGDRDIVSFTALITLPAIVLSKPSGTILLTNTATAPGVPPRRVSTTAAYRIGPPRPPATGANPNVTRELLLLLGGLGLIVIGAVARKPTRSVWGRVP